MSLICFPVIDFVAPYFDQSGISILLRKKKRETNVFKFLSVLKPEVCLRTLKSIVHTTLYYWFLLILFILLQNVLIGVVWNSWCSGGCFSSTLGLGSLFSLFLLQ